MGFKRSWDRGGADLQETSSSTRFNRVTSPTRTSLPHPRDSGTLIRVVTQSPLLW